MHQLIVSAGKYDTVEIVENQSAGELKSRIREAIHDGTEYSEILFYFTGHGIQTKSDFYFCSTDFDSARPNETGLAHKELFDFIRAGSPDVFVLITDACNSGTLVIKGEGGFLPTPKDGLRNYIQIASCLDSQVSLSGDPLSEFTERFCQAVLRKTEGPVYFSDVINVLRDDYIDDGNQTPFFVHQGTMRQYLTPDAKSLEDFRARFNTEWLSASSECEVESEDEDDVVNLLRRAEGLFANSELVPKAIDAVFDRALAQVEELDLGDIFDISSSFAKDFYDQPSIDHMISVLHKESRPDDFVSVQKKKPLDASAYGLGISASYISDILFDAKNWELKLNYPLERVQMTITLMPKFKSMKKLNVRISCAPSLRHLYVFSGITEYRLSDMDHFRNEGTVSDKRYYKVDWDSDPLWVARDYIAKDVDGAVDKQLASVRKMIGDA